MKRMCNKNMPNKKNYIPLYELNDVLKNPYKRNKISKKYTLKPNEDEKVLKTFCGT